MKLLEVHSEVTVDLGIIMFSYNLARQQHRQDFKSEISRLHLEKLSCDAAVWSV